MSGQRVSRNKVIAIVVSDFVPAQIGKMGLVLNPGRMSLQTVAETLVDGIENDAIRERLVLCFTTASLETEAVTKAIAHRVDAAEAKATDFYNAFVNWWNANRSRLAAECAE